MTHRLPLLAALVVSLISTTEAPASEKSGKKTPWIHIEVQEAGQKEAKVKVNLPLKLARTALELAPDDVMNDGRIKIENTELTVRDLRKMWQDVREAGDAEFVTVEEESSTVRIYRKGDRLFVNVDDTSNKEEVRIEVPISLVDALLTGSGDTLNVDAAVAELEKMGPGEVVRVQDGEDSVRIWIE